MTRFTVRPDKISRYLLDPASREGGSKARFFLGRGFVLDQPANLASALIQHTADACLASRTDARDGIRLVYECAMAAADGSRPCIRSIWIGEGSSFRLITAYPMRLRKLDP